MLQYWYLYELFYIDLKKQSVGRHLNQYLHFVELYLVVTFLPLLPPHADKTKIATIKKLKIFFINEFPLNIYKTFTSTLISTDNPSDKVT